MAKLAQHVMPVGGKWSILKSGSPCATRTFDTEEQAVEVAAAFARKQRTVPFIHDSNGRVLERRSWVADPEPGRK